MVTPKFLRFMFTILGLLFIYFIQEFLIIFVLDGVPEATTKIFFTGIFVSAAYLIIMFLFFVMKIHKRKKNDDL